MDSLFLFFGLWTWFIIAAVLLLLELVASGIFFVFLGLAAIIVGLLDLVFSMNWQVEIAAFAVLSVVLVMVGRPLVTKNIKSETDQPNLNQRNREFIGRRLKLSEPITSGTGTLNINDTLWRIRGDDLPAGTWVKVTGVDGLELIVERDDQT